MGNRSSARWIEYFHHALGWVTAQGCYLFDSGLGVARYKPEDVDDVVKRVDAVAWAPIRSAVKPCEGLVISKRLGDCKPDERRSRRGRLNRA